MAALVGAGYHVQLKHHKKETSWEDHGWVECCSPTGEVLARDESFQRNPFYSTSAKKTTAFMAEIPAPASLAARPASSPPNLPSSSAGAFFSAIAAVFTPRRTRVVLKEVKAEGKEENKVAGVEDKELATAA